MSESGDTNLDLDFIDDLDLNELELEQKQDLTNKKVSVPVNAIKSRRKIVIDSSTTHITNPVKSIEIGKTEIGSSFILNIAKASISQEDYLKLINDISLVTLYSAIAKMKRDKPSASQNVVLSGTAKTPLTFVIACPSKSVEESSTIRQITLFDPTRNASFYAKSFIDILPFSVYAIKNIAGYMTKSSVSITLKKSDIFVGIADAQLCSGRACNKLAYNGALLCSYHKNQSSLSSASYEVSAVVATLLLDQDDNKPVEESKSYMSLAKSMVASETRNEQIQQSLNSTLRNTRAAQVLAPTIINTNTTAYNLVKTSFTSLSSSFNAKDATKKLMKEESDKHVERMAKEEAKELYLDSIKEIKVKAWRCSKCGTLSSNKPETCIDAGHYCKLIDTVKRFWECGKCGMRCASLGSFQPGVNCKKCGSRNWKQSSAASQGFFTSVRDALSKRP